MMRNSPVKPEYRVSVELMATEFLLLMLSR